MRQMRALVFLTLVLSFSAVCATAQTDPFTVTAKPGADSSTWIYTLTNNDSENKMVVLMLELNWDTTWDENAPRPDFQITHTPEGWDINDYYPWASWSATRTNEPTGGNSLEGFDVSCPQLGAPSYFTVWYIDEWAQQVPQEGDVHFVPEPSGLLVALSGLAGLALRRRRPR